MTICTHNKECILGEIVGNGLDHSDSINLTCNMKLNHYGEIVEKELGSISEHFSNIIGLYKSGVSRRCGVSIWQKSFHDHIIRNEPEYQKIWEYINTNHLKWELDCYHVK